MPCCYIARSDLATVTSPSFHSSQSKLSKAKAPRTQFCELCPDIAQGVRLLEVGTGITVSKTKSPSEYLNNVVILMVRRSTRGTNAISHAVEAKEVALALRRNSMDCASGEEIRLQQRLQPQRPLAELGVDNHPFRHPLRPLGYQSMFLRSHVLLPAFQDSRRPMNDNILAR